MYSEKQFPNKEPSYRLTAHHMPTFDEFLDPPVDPNIQQRVFKILNHPGNILLLLLLLRPFYDPLSGTTQLSRYLKDKPFWILLKQT